MNTTADNDSEAHPGSQTSYRSKTLTTWLAFVGGSIGLHRFYLHGLKDMPGWLLCVPTLVGVYGVQRMLEYGQDDKTAWLLIPFLGLTLAGSMLMAIVYGLTPEEKWGSGGATTWLTILGVVMALLIGAGFLMATIAFAGQRYFEYEAEQPKTAQANSTRLAQ